MAKNKTPKAKGTRPSPAPSMDDAPFLMSEEEFKTPEEQRADSTWAAAMQRLFPSLRATKKKKK